MTKLLRIFFLRSENIKWILGYSVGNSFNVIFPKDIIYLKKKNFAILYVDNYVKQDKKLAF